MAQRIGNLLGQLEFSDDQLMRTQQGLNDAGVSMPNFGNVGRELAKEINEPEVEVESEEDSKYTTISFENHNSCFLQDNIDSLWKTWSPLLHCKPSSEAFSTENASRLSSAASDSQTGTSSKSKLKLEVSFSAVN